MKAWFGKLRLLRQELEQGGMRESDVGAKLYKVYVDRRRGVTTVTAGYLAAQSILTPKLRVPE